MTKTQEEKTSRLKPYQMILLSCLLATFMIVNSNYVNYNRDLEKLNKEKGELFDNIINIRKLSSKNYSEEICTRASDDLNEYYQTGDLSKIDIDDGSIDCKDKDQTYMAALISIVRTMLDDSEENENSSPVTPPDSGNSGTRRNLRNLGGFSDIEKQDITDYAMRLLAMLVFIVFGIFSIFGWIFCCICCCCDCCCCCCCKKTTCKIPCFIFTYIFYALVVSICVYGLTQANKIFVGLADTECSLLKFFEQVIYGETKQSLPRWAGIESIKSLLTDINDTITDLSEDSYQQLNDSVANISNTKQSFEQKMKDAGDNFYNNGFKSPYTTTVNGLGDNLDGDYVYKEVYMFGRYEGNDFTPSSFLYIWNQEFSFIANDAYRYLTDARDDFTDILGDSLGDVQDALSDGKDALDDLVDPFNDVSDSIGEILSDYSEYIDKYGKMGVKIVFGGLMVINVALAVLMLLICMCSGQSCTSCCCCRCIFKTCVHVFWNILALLMILTFIIGSLIALVGRLGGDAMGLVSYIMSIDNFNGTNPLLVDKLDKAKDYVYTCMHGNGDIAAQLGLGNSLNSFSGINDVENNITTIRNTFISLTSQIGTYAKLNQELEDQNDYKKNITMVKKDNPTKTISYYEYLKKINDLEGVNDIWSVDTENSHSCDSNLNGQNYHPRECKPYDNDMKTKYSSETNYAKYSEILEKLDTFRSKAYDESKHIVTTDAPSVKKVIDDLKREYDKYLGCYIDILNFFIRTIHRITDLIRPYIGSGGNAFDFLNGKFIGTNLKIILKYLNHSLGTDFFTVGILLCVVGCSLILSVSSTILLIVIINIGLAEAIKQKNVGGADTVVSQFENNPNQNISPKGY